MPAFLVIGLASCAAQEMQPSPSTALPGTAWRLDNLGGSSVLDRVEVTLEFTDSGRVAGNASCNRFFGTFQASDQQISFGQMGSTRMACAEPIAAQEARYLEALQEAERFTTNGTVLSIYFRGSTNPLRFIRKER
jgi:heat shock protein HslJ